jgi:hypothetical protein
MGKENPSRFRNSKSVVQTLEDAERDHFIDCPNADITYRTAAFLLDCILFSLAHSGVSQTLATFWSVVSQLSYLSSILSTQGMQYLDICLLALVKGLLIFFYFEII